LGGKRTPGLAGISWHCLEAKGFLMRFVLPVAVALTVSGCATPNAAKHVSVQPELVAAERLIDAFYSFDAAQLRAALSDAPASQPNCFTTKGGPKAGIT
jgi:hypothetical protein